MTGQAPRRRRTRRVFDSDGNFIELDVDDFADLRSDSVSDAVDHIVRPRSTPRAGL